MVPQPTILIIGDETGVSKPVKALGFQAVVAPRLQDALLKIKVVAPSMVVVNLPGPRVERSLLRQLSLEDRPILILADAGETSGYAIPQNGKVRVLARPVQDLELHAALRMALRPAPSFEEGTEDMRPEDRYLTEYAPLFKHSEKMQAIREIIEQVADTNATVLIRGESGVGKELVARAIHYASPRCGQSFLKVNCAALPAELLESELFGHEKGAFTGAYRRKPGKFEFANKGTLFLDEIGELPLALQAKLLHVLQDQEFSRVGGREMIRIDTRVIASTNRNLESAIEAGQFREDLYYRLNVVEIHVPPLRERTEEIPALLAYFLEKFQRQYGRTATLPPETVRFLTEYTWPGNIRELENIVRRLVVLSSVDQIQKEIRSRLQHSHVKQPEVTREEKASPVPAPAPERSMGLREIARRAAQEAERAAIREVLERVRWNRAQAARLLKVSYKTLLSKIAELGLQ